MSALQSPVLCLLCNFRLYWLSPHCSSALTNLFLVVPQFCTTSRKARLQRASLFRRVDDSTPAPVCQCCVTCVDVSGQYTGTCNIMCAWHASMHGAALITLYHSMECRPASGAHASPHRKGQCYACNSATFLWRNKILYVSKVPRVVKNGVSARGKRGSALWQLGEWHPSKLASLHFLNWHGAYQVR